jgi:hypothetical protein
MIRTNIVQLYVYRQAKEKLFYDSSLGVGELSVCPSPSTNNNVHNKKKTWALTILHWWGGVGG